MSGAMSKIEIESTSDSAAGAIASPGAILRSAREAAGYSRAEMADKLNWLSCYVEAIEEDRYEAFSSRAFATGYMKSYGRYLKVAEDVYLEAHHQMLAAAGGAVEREPLSGVRPPRQVVVSSRAGLYGAGLVLAALIALLWWQQTQPTPQQPSATDSDAAEQSATLEMSEIVSGIEETAAAYSTPIATDAATAAGQEPVDFSDVERENSIVDAADTESETGLEAVGILEFRFTAECWLEVRDSRGDLIYANLRRAGDTLTLEGAAPFDVLLGDASAATLSYLGAAVPISAVDGRKFARLSVGD